MNWLTQLLGRAPVGHWKEELEQEQESVRQAHREQEKQIREAEARRRVAAAELRTLQRYVDRRGHQNGA